MSTSILRSPENTPKKLPPRPLTFNEDSLKPNNSSTSRSSRRHTHAHRKSLSQTYFSFLDPTAAPVSADVSSALSTPTTCTPETISSKGTTPSSTPLKRWSFHTPKPAQPLTLVDTQRAGAAEADRKRTALLWISTFLNAIVALKVWALAHNNDSTLAACLSQSCALNALCGFFSVFDSNDNASCIGRSLREPFGRIRKKLVKRMILLIFALFSMLMALKEAVEHWTAWHATHRIVVPARTVLLSVFPAQVLAFYAQSSLLLRSQGRFAVLNFLYTHMRPFDPFTGLQICLSIVGILFGRQHFTFPSTDISISIAYATLYVSLCLPDLLATASILLEEPLPIEEALSNELEQIMHIPEVVLISKLHAHALDIRDATNSQPLRTRRTSSSHKFDVVKLPAEELMQPLRLQMELEVAEQAGDQELIDITKKASEILRRPFEQSFIGCAEIVIQVKRTVVK